MDSQSQYDEFELRDYIKGIIKRRKLILIIFCAVLIGTTVLSLLKPKVYEATSLLLIVPSKIETSLDAPNLFVKDQQAGLLANSKQDPSFEAHKVLMTSSAVLERVIKRLNMVDNSGKNILPDDLLGELDLKDNEKTNIFKLSVRDKDPVLAMNLANVWAQEYIQYSQELISGEIKGVGDFVDDQFTTAKSNLVIAQEKLAAFNEQYKYDQMQAGLTMKKNKLNSDKLELLNTKANIKPQEELLKELKDELVNQSQFIVTSKAITDDALWQQTAQEKDLSDVDKLKLKSESVNPIYQDLESRIVDTETDLNVSRSKIAYLQEDIINLENDVDESEKTLDQVQIKFDQLNMELASCKQTYDHLSVKIEEAKMAKATELGEVKLVSTAYQPQHPLSRISLKRMMMMAIIGLMLGLLAAFFKEWFGKK